MSRLFHPQKQPHKVSRRGAGRYPCCCFALSSQSRGKTAPVPVPNRSQSLEWGRHVFGDTAMQDSFSAAKKKEAAHRIGFQQHLPPGSERASFRGFLAGAKCKGEEP